MLYFRNDVASRYSKLSRFDILAVHTRNALISPRAAPAATSRERFSALSFVPFFVSFSLAFWDSPRYHLFSEFDPRHAEYFCNWTAVSDVYFQRSKRGMCKRRLCKLTRGIATLCIAVTAMARESPYALAIDLHRDRLGLSNLRSLIYAINILCAFA